MALDGIAVFNIAADLHNLLENSRIDKIYQPERDEIVISTRSKAGNYKLLLTANSSYPRIHITNESKGNPLSAPLFCMVLRKHLTNGKILKIEQPIFDRIINIHIEAYNEMGDLSVKKLIIEIMGKHSNIILTDSDNKVLESIKHVPLDKSSVRPIFPGRIYTLPPNNDRLNPLALERESFAEGFKDDNDVKSLIFHRYNGISPVIAAEVLYRSGVSENAKSSDVSADLIFDKFSEVMDNVKEQKFVNQLVYDEYKKLKDFTCIEMKLFEKYKKIDCKNISELLETYYKEKDSVYRINQKSTDLKRLLENNIDRCNKKSKLYEKTLRDIENRDELRLWGELINSNIYSIPKGAKEFTCQNFYDENLSDITIRLDPDLSPSDNAQRYFKKYQKAKRTFDALQIQIKENEDERDYLETVINSLSASQDDADISQIREELYKEGYLKKKKNQSKSKKEKSKKTGPLHFVSDGFDIYVGKNNIQNDELTLKFAKPSDIWLHTKNIPGSHVIIKLDGKTPTDEVLLTAANLAAFYSKGKDGVNIAVDYTEKRNVKKPSGAKPGMVIYETNKTIFITPDEEIIRNLDDTKTIQ